MNWSTSHVGGEQAAETEEVGLERASNDSLRNGHVVGAQAVVFEKRDENSETFDAEPLNESPPGRTREVDSVVSLVVPEQVASFDVFG